MTTPFYTPTGFASQRDNYRRTVTLEVFQFTRKEQFCKTFLVSIPYTPCVLTFVIIFGP